MSSKPNATSHIFHPEKIIVHHSLTRDSGTVSWGAIRKYHTQTLKWDGIGYHAGVELVMSGTEANYEVLMGRMWDKPGAHTRGHNHDSLGICFIGDYDKLPPKREMLKAGAEIIALWMKIYDISINNIFTHHEFNKRKSCPGVLFSLFTLKMLIQNIRRVDDGEEEN